MNKQETAQIITFLAGNYNKIAEKTKEQKLMMVETWYECLNDLDYKGYKYSPTSNVILKGIQMNNQ